VKAFGCAAPTLYVASETVVLCPCGAARGGGRCAGLTGGGGMAVEAIGGGGGLMRAAWQTKT